MLAPLVACGAPGEIRPGADAGSRDAGSTSSVDRDGGPMLDASPASPDELRVLFPPRRCGTVASSLTVRGTAAAGTRSVSVDGALAQSDNGFATWHANMHVRDGTNIVRVVAEDASGAAVAVVFSVARWADASAVDLGGGDPPGGQNLTLEPVPDRGTVFYVDGYWDSLVAIDLGSSTRMAIAGDRVPGSGPAGLQMHGPRDPTYDPTRGLIYLTDPNAGVILRADLDAHTYDVLAQRLDPSEPALDEEARLVGFPGALALDPASDPEHDRLLFIERASPVGYPHLLAINLADGSIDIVSDEAHGAGPDMDLPVAFAVDAAGRRAFIPEQYSDRLLRIDLTTGDRTLLLDRHGEAPGTSGPPLTGYGGVDWVNETRTLIAWSTDLDALVAIDPDNGERTVISSATRGTGLLPEYAADLGDAGDWVAVADERASSGLALIHAIDVVSGDRVVLHRMDLLHE